MMLMMKDRTSEQKQTFIQKNQKDFVFQKSLQKGKISLYLKLDCENMIRMWIS